MLLTTNSLRISRRRDIAAPDLADAFYQLARLLDAGISLDESLVEISAVSGSRCARPTWRLLARDVSAGKSLSEAMLQSMPSMDSSALAIIKAGEASGDIQQACQAVSDHLRWQLELRQRLITVLIYPLFSVCLLLLVTAYLLVSVIPSIEGFLSSSRVELAWHTGLLIRISSWVNWFYTNALPASALASSLLVLAVVKSRFLRAMCDKCILYIPAVGALIRGLSLSRYTHCCAQLYTSGITLDQSMALAEATVHNKSISSELARVRQLLVNGMSLGESMQQVSVIPAVASRMMHIGESSGQLAQVLYTVSEHTRQTADVSIKRLEQMIAPLLLLFVGLILLWIVVSVLGPVYNLAIDTVMDVH